MKRVLLLVLVVLMLVASGLLWWTGRQRKPSADVASTQVSLSLFGKMARAYELEHGVYPDGGAREVIGKLNELTGMDVSDVDVWGNGFLMMPRGAGEMPVFYSAGPDGVDDGGAAGSDDVLGLD